MSVHAAQAGVRPPGGAGNDVVLSASGVTVKFGGLVALKDVDLRVCAGEVVGLVGPNGAGKTTLFGVLSGALKPVQGRVSLAGTDVTRLSAYRRARRGLARSFQQPELFDSLTVAEHLLLGWRMAHARRRLLTDLIDFSAWRGPTPGERQSVDHILRVLSLEQYSDQDCSALPTGVARLVEVGRGLAMSPRVLLLDEPAAGLDSSETGELLLALERAAQEDNIALVVVEHDLDFVLGLCRRVYVLDAGAVIASGTPNEVRMDKGVQEAYLGPMQTGASR